MLIVALTEDFSASGFEFLMTDVSIGLAFADIALGAPEARVSTGRKLS
jgi:hypothetical protein